MKQTLIKLNEQHYIVVDDSEIKEPFDGYCLDDEGNIRHGRSDLHTLLLSKKITHSTLPNKGMENVNFISLSEVEEAINGYSVEKMAKEEHQYNHKRIDEKSFRLGYEVGFKAHQELVKDKLFTIEDMKLFAAELIGRYKSGKIQEFEDVQDIIESYLPKTEWEVEITPEGKIVLL